ncbi:MAG: hypothetical protein ACI9R3_005976 [Verrucomicrobiales bacterium]|jgi:hypothetical protein
MGIGKHQPFLRQLVDVRRFHARSAIATDIAKPQIIYINHHNVRLVGSHYCARKTEQGSYTT